VDGRAKYLCQQLRAEADPKDELLLLQAFRHQRLLGAKPLILLFVMDAHRTAHDDQQIEGVERRQGFPLIEPNDLKVMPAIGSPCLDVPRALERDVLQTGDTHLSPDNKPL